MSFIVRKNNYLSKNNSDMVESSDKELNVEARKQRLQVEKKLWKTSLALVLVWLFSWSPYASVFLANITGHAGLVTHHLDMLPGTLLCCKHSLQPDLCNV